MWFNYGRIFAEYLYIDKFRNSPIFSKKIKVENQNILDEIKASGEQVIFVSPKTPKPRLFEITG